MTNREKYEKEIIDYVFKYYETPAIAKDNGKVCSCNDIKCENCVFYPSHNDVLVVNSCETEFVKWAKQEYEEHKIDWNKVPVDTKVLILDDEGKEAERAYFSHCKDGKIFIFTPPYNNYTLNDLPVNKIGFLEINSKYIKIFDKEEEKKYWKD